MRGSCNPGGGHRMARSWRYSKPSLTIIAPFSDLRACVYAPCTRFYFVGSLRVSASYLSFPAHVVLVHLYSIFLSFGRFCRVFFLSSCWSLVDIPLIFSCPAGPRTGLATAYVRLLGMVEARWVNVRNAHTHKHTASMRMA